MKKSFQRVIATLNLFQGKQSLTICLLAAFFALSACDNSSSASEDNNETSAVESSSSMSTDKEKSSDSKTKQSNSSGEEQNSSNTEKMSSSSQKNSSKSNSSSSIDEKEPRTSSSGSCKNGETRESDVLGVAIQYDHCENGRWVIDSTVIVVDTSIHYTFHPNLDSVFNPDVEYGEFKDKRDGNVYKTITFVDGYGDTRTMFAQNLNYGTFVKLGENSDAEVQKHCYDDDEWYCDHYFGGLYTWSETFGFPRACDTIPVGTSPACPDTVWYDPDPDVNNDGWKSIIHKQGICPDGWHILTYDEWNAAIGQTVLWRALSKASWWYENGATNQAGISLLATGYIDEKTFKYRGEQTEFWYSVHAGYGVDMLGTDKAKGFRIYTDEKYIKTATLTKVAYYPKKTAFPIRCVMDKE
jgi:uncharacterized protein (TIGR02145 family)